MSTPKFVGGGAMKRQRLSPLSPAERAVATRHYQMIDRYIAQRALPKDEYYDIVALGFLLAVKKWFSRPDLYQYEFSTIAWASMRSAVSNEKRKQARRIKTVSLDDPIPGTDGMTWADIITEEHLVYSA